MKSAIIKTLVSVVAILGPTGVARAEMIGLYECTNVGYGPMLTSFVREIDPRNAACSSKAFSAVTKPFPTASARSWRSMCPATSPIF